MDAFSAPAATPSLSLRCKIVLVGDSTVGKTSIANVFSRGAANASKDYKMTVGADLMVKRVNIPETNVFVEMYIVDCGGFSACQDVLKPHWETANAEQIKNYRMESAITGVVVASKTDLASRPGAVATQMGKAFASELGLEFFDTCATEGNVDAPFHFLAEVFWQKYNERKEQLDNMH
eukprot:gnl/TRDRNA2_/TRDRNA2_169679_c0_seq2.p2 gnl/TRDRNA2_/TRDRNA2_169679_c0~~gnl/TRDRNA2_/TRDRNA2_169679_c0_seq2.p2  ORF type:complete len:178 (+),score=44.95 gnl/TRDRNA2_/TRDRNA2_169679_c0_seq2:94-627(+)